MADEEWLRIVKWLDDPKWRSRYGSELDSVEESHEILANTYQEIMEGAIAGTLFLLIFLLLIDSSISMNSLLYGLTINIWASIFILYPSLRGRYMIAGISENIDQAAVRRLETRRVVFSIVGFGLMGFGFLLQTFAHQSSNTEFIKINILASIIPSWAAPILIIFSFAAIFRYFS